ncbi:penicillin-binding transpeptidase domain-containing protein [Sphingomonas sp. MMS24-JH45]
MTVRAAAQTGMGNVVKLMKDMQVGDYQPYLSYALGAGETTVAKMVNAYGVLANHGQWHDPSLVDFVSSRDGKVIWPNQWRACQLNMKAWDGKAMPRPVTRGRQVVDAMSAFQMIHITEGVVQRGTATALNDLGRPIFGKTGTNSGPTDVWFIGGTPQMIGGLYMGCEPPRNLGGYAQGGSTRGSNIKSFQKKAWEGMEVLPFRAPRGIRMVRIDRALRAAGVRLLALAAAEFKPAVIWEAFKPQAEARRARRVSPTATPTATATQKAQEPRDSEFLQRQGGIY